ncbi:hypothetical protein WJ25_14885 [Burkholderia thailandensis]|nr:hypothetical protein WJ25_14885 [Burkholderia thailandensis]
MRGDCVDARRAGAAANRAHATAARLRTRAPHARRVGETAANPGFERRPRPHARRRASTFVAPSVSSAAIAEQFV